MTTGTRWIRRTSTMFVFLLLALPLLASAVHAEPKLIAIGSISGTYEDFAVETAAPLENGVPGNRLGGMGSGLAYAGGNTFPRPARPRPEREALQCWRGRHGILHRALPDAESEPRAERPRLALAVHAHADARRHHSSVEQIAARVRRRLGRLSGPPRRRAGAERNQSHPLLHGTVG